MSAFPVYTGDKGQKAELWFEDFKVFCSNAGVDPRSYLELKLSHAVPASASVSPREVLGHLKRKNVGVPITLEAVRKAMVSQFEKHVFDKSHHARDCLMDGSYKMKSSEKFIEYQTRFENILVDAPDMGETDRIKWLLAGLSPALKPLCSVSHDGSAWSAYDALVKFASGQEQRLDANRPAKGAKVHTPPSRHRRQDELKELHQEGKWQRVGGKRRASVGGGGPGGSGGSSSKTGRGGRGGRDGKGGRGNKGGRGKGFSESDPRWRSQKFRELCWEQRLCNVCGMPGHTQHDDACGAIDHSALKRMERPPGAK